jgi:multiple antibiotic resistance protein
MSTAREQSAFIFTICFVLLGPIKLIGPFARLTRGRPPGFCRSAAAWATLLASAVCLFVALVGRTLVEKYELSLPALLLSTGLILLLSALGTAFPRGDAPDSPGEAASPVQLAISPLATPTIVPAAGVAAILMFVMSASKYPGIYQALAISLGVIMPLNFLVMFFNDRTLRTPGLLPVLHLLGETLSVIQVALAIDTMLAAFRALAVVTG